MFESNPETRSSKLARCLGDIHQFHVELFDIDSLSEQAFEMLEDILKIYSEHLGGLDQVKNTSCLHALGRCYVKHRSLESEERKRVYVTAAALRKYMVLKIEEGARNGNEFAYMSNPCLIPAVSEN